MQQSLWTREDLTPFARRIRDYMLEQKPTLTVAGLAKLTREVDPAGKDVSPPAMWDWFNKDAVPKYETLELVSTATGIALGELVELASLSRPFEDAVRDLVERIEKDRRIPDSARRDLEQSITDVFKRATAAS